MVLYPKNHVRRLKAPLYFRKPLDTTMPRLTIRKILLYGICAATITLGILNLTYNHVELRSRHGPLKQLLFDSDESANTELLLKDDQTYSYDEALKIFQVPRISNDQLKAIPKLWFMKDGWMRPERAKVDKITNQRLTKLWPEEEDSDRIVQQLMFVPPDYPSPEQREKDVKLKKILVYHGIRLWRPLKLGRETFLSDKCPVDTCEVTVEHGEAETADAILFRDHAGNAVADISNRPYEQVWILYLLESPHHSQSFIHKNIFNWTATYRHDSDIVTPYEKFVPYSREKMVRQTMDRNYAAKKSKKVAWFVSNCGAQNRRKEYVDELARYIDVDIYGACGTLLCPRAKGNECFKKLNAEYKFYLSFENSNCKDYITEKYYVNGLGNDVVPIVMGGRKEDYERVSPPHSYIHIEDFASPRDLADYLHMLDRNDTLYNEYFRWKGTGEFINTYFWCRVCALLHDKHPPKVYEDINTWWRGPGTCITKRWDSKKASIEHEKNNHHV